jgi:Tfp pilus assembly protein PilO
MLHIDYVANQRFGHVAHCAGGLLVLVAVVATYIFHHAPTTEATSQARAEIAKIQQALRNAPAIQRRHAELREKLREMEDRLARIRRRVPRDAGESEFLSALTTMAEEVGMAITNLSPSSPRQLPGYMQMDVSIGGLASYESVCRFVDRIRRFPRLAKVVGLEVRAAGPGESVYPVSITVAIFYDLVVQPGGEA